MTLTYGSWKQAPSIILLPKFKSVWFPRRFNWGASMSLCEIECLRVPVSCSGSVSWVLNLNFSKLVYWWQPSIKLQNLKGYIYTLHPDNSLLLTFHKQKRFKPGSSQHKISNIATWATTIYSLAWGAWVWWLGRRTWALSRYYSNGFSLKVFKVVGKDQITC